MRARIRVARDIRIRLFDADRDLGPGCRRACDSRRRPGDTGRQSVTPKGHVFASFTASPTPDRSTSTSTGRSRSLALLFGDTSGDVVLRGGEHAFAVVPTGAPPETAIAAGTIALGNDTLAYAALLGTLDSASVGLFEVDDRPLDQGRARFRIISGVPDAGEITPMFAGGDALSEPLGFGDASQYASIDAGTYDLDFLEAASGVSLLALPQTPFAEGTTTDVILVGQVSDGTMTALVQPIQVELARAVGRSAQIFTGSCARPRSCRGRSGDRADRAGRGGRVRRDGSGGSGIRRCRRSPLPPSSRLRTPSSFRKTSTPVATWLPAATSAAT